MKIKAIVLASGFSSRFKSNKLLYELNGKKLICYVLDLLKKCEIEMVVVTQYEEIKEIALSYGADCCLNEFPSKGISYSIQLGVEHFYNEEGLLFLVADQPYLTKETIMTLMNQADEEHIIYCASTKRKGNPAIFPKKYFEELRELRNDVGGKQIIKKYPQQVIEVNVEDIELEDIDYKGK